MNKTKINEIKEMKIGLIVNTKNKNYFNLFLDIPHISLIEKTYDDLDPQKLSNCDLIIIDLNIKIIDIVIDDIQNKIRDIVFRLKYYNSNLSILLNNSLISIGFCDDLECFMMNNSYLSSEFTKHRILIGLLKNEKKK